MGSAAKPWKEMDLQILRYGNGLHELNLIYTRFLPKTGHFASTLLMNQ